MLKMFIVQITNGQFFIVALKINTKYATRESRFVSAGRSEW